VTAVRTLALWAQGLATANGAEPLPTPDAIHDVVAQLGCVQIDTLQMVRRSHYLAVWSRLGCYAPADFDRLIYAAPRRLFEDWLHAACILPLTEYRYRLPHKRRLRTHGATHTVQWLSEPGNVELLAATLERIRKDGAVGVGDFEYDGPKRGSWWDWKPVKHALEHLFAWGDLTIANRVSFQRVYDLTERVLPEWVDTSEPTREDMIRHTLEFAVRGFGVCQPNQVADYIHEISNAEARLYVQQLVGEGILTLVQAIFSDGKPHDVIVHRDSLPMLEQAAEGAIAARRTTFLTPFDSIFWPHGRDEQLWGFRKSLEAYLPAPKRQYGYFCLPILHGERLVGRFDPKLERATGTLRLKAFYLEPDVQPTPELVHGIAGALRDFMAFHDAHNLLIERSSPDGVGARLLAAL
jgi:hypothetical protein